MSDDQEGKKELQKRNIERRTGGDRRKCMMFVEVDRRKNKERRSGKERRTIDTQRGIPTKDDSEPSSNEE